MVSVRSLNYFSPCTSTHALALMASSLNVQCASRATVSFTWHGHHLHVSHANQMLISMTGWLNVRLSTAAINQWGITVRSLDGAGVSPPNQSNCFLLQSNEQIFWLQPAKHQAWPWDQRLTWSRDAASTSKKGKDKAICWPWRVWPTTWQTNSTYQSGDCQTNTQSCSY